MKNREPSGLAWIHLETTGLDPLKDEILEIAVVLTDLRLKQLASWESVVRITPAGAARLTRDTYVQEMHDKTGLLKESLTSSVKLSEAVLSLLKFLDDSQFSRKQLILAGSGTAHFVLPFIKARMPVLTEWFPQYPLDVEGTRRGIGILTQGTIPQPKQEFAKGRRQNRAMDSIQRQLLEADQLAAFLRERLTDVY